MVTSLQKRRQMTTSMVVIVAIVAALGLVGVVAFTIIATIQQVEAIGCPLENIKEVPAFVASDGKCEQPDRRPPDL